MSGSAIVRAEKSGDQAAIRRVHELAFGGTAEADIVDALRRNRAVTLSLVAEVAGEIAGHVLFSPVEIEGTRARIVGLAPMAVLPSHQRRGFGSELVRGSIDRLRSSHDAIVVLGHPEYYPRFGFARASGFGLRSEFECPDGAFMVLELRPGSLKDRSGIVRYRAELGGH